MNIESNGTYTISKAEIVTIGPDNHGLGDVESFVIEPRVRRLSARPMRRRDRRAAIASFYALDIDDLVERHGRPALAVMTKERFDSAIAELNAAGRRFDLRIKGEFAKTVDALADVFGRRVA